MSDDALLPNFWKVLNVFQKQAHEDFRRLEAESEAKRDEILQEWTDLQLLSIAAPGRRGPLEILVNALTLGNGPSEEERAAVVERLARKWAAQSWKFYDPRLWDAALGAAATRGMRVRDLKERLLQRTIFLAIYDTRKLQVTRIGDDGLVRFGSRLRLLQKQELEQMAREGLTPKLLEKLLAPPAGVHAFPPYRLMSSIQAVYAGFDMDRAYPSDLRPSLFHHWVRRRAIHRAEEWLLREGGFDPDKFHPSWRRVEVIEPRSGEDDPKSGGTEQVGEIELLDALDRAQPHPLRRILARERLAELLDAATGAERETIELLQLFHVNVGLPKAEAIKKIAEVRGVSVNTVHQTLSRIRRNHGN